MAITRNNLSIDGSSSTQNLRRTHDWDSIEISIPDKEAFEIYMVSDITYKEQYPKTQVRGRKNLVYAVSNGSPDLSASITLSVFELDEILRRAESNSTPFNDSTRKVQNIAPFDITIKYSKPSTDAGTLGETYEKIVTLKSCSLDNYEVSTKLGDSDSNTTVNLNPVAIEIGAWKLV